MQKNQELGSIGAQEHQSIRAQKLCSYTLMTCALVLAGCARQHRRDIAELVYVRDSAAAGIGKAEMMVLAEEVLADMHFSIEKADIENGLIRTRPLPGAQFFELWRSDNVGAENSLRANLHTIRRTVEIDITQQGRQLRIGCDVRVQRLSLPEREAGGSSARAYEMYSRSSPSLQKLRFDPEQKEGMAWIDLGSDTQLAAAILKRIEEQIARRASDETPMTGRNS
ncbi:MAG: hypothetical protein ABIF19_16785 [Planctomycetota bacterium]